MFIRSLLLSVSALSLTVSAQLNERQAVTSSASSSASLASGLTTTVITTSIFPGGVSTGSTGLEATLPLPCIDGCWQFAAPYGYCFLFRTFPNGTATNGSSCPGLCTQAYYDGLSACLNCIVANGNERPFGYSSNTSITALPSRTSSPSASGSSSAVRPLIDTRNPNGLINLNQANGWLANMTSLCGSSGVTLTGASSVTALPTTTGPYAASWTRGQTISRTAWTGLTQYSPPVATYTATVPINQGQQSGGGGSAASGGSGSAASGAAASSSSRAAAFDTASPGGWAIGGALLAWAVL